MEHEKLAQSLQRPASAKQTTTTSARSPHKSPSPRKPPFVLADWKHRVPEPELPGPKPAAGSLNSHQRDKLVQERKRQLATEYTCVHNTIDSILNRCKQVQQRLGSSSSTSAAGSSSNNQHGPTYLSARSKLLFQAPQPSGCSENTVNTSHMAWAQATVCAASSGSNNDHASPEVQGQLAAAGQQQQQQQQEQPQAASDPAASLAWAGAVDLNPGFSFLSGTPQRLAATCPDELPMVLAHFSSLLDDVKRMNLSCLHHREALQAGIQQLNGEFYAALKKAAVKQHKEQGLPGVIPSSWYSRI